MVERSLLIVDDEENILSALTRLLRREGYTLHRASSAVEALETLTKHEVGVILSDQRMPGMTGVEFLNKVKELYPDTVRIVLSGYTDLQSVTDAVNRGAVYKFLTKPWDDGLLLANIRDAFRNYELRKENERLTIELQQANKDLEQRVDDKTREALRNLRVLQASQDVLECLPLAVIGIDECGLIVMANIEAHLFLGCAYGGVVGQFAEDILPEPVRAWMSAQHEETATGLVAFGPAYTARAWLRTLAGGVGTRGTVLVLSHGDADQEV